MLDKNELKQYMNQKELIVMRDALKEYAVSLRMIDGVVTMSKQAKDSQLLKELGTTQYTLHPHTIALGLIAEIEAIIK